MQCQNPMLKVLAVLAAGNRPSDPNSQWLRGNL
jgi:hypothetical protein